MIEQHEQYYQPISALDSETGHPAPVPLLHGNLPVSPTYSPSGVLASREVNALGTTPVLVEWTEAEDVRKVFVHVLNEEQTTANVNAVALTWDIPDTTTGANWLTAGNHLSDASERLLLPPGIHGPFDFDSWLSNCYIKRDLGSDAMRVLFVAGGR